MTPDYDRHLEAILDAAQAIIEGNLDREIQIDAEGILAHLAGTINQIILNLRTVQPSLDLVTDEAPSLATTAQSVHDLMHNATQTSLDRADAILAHCEALEKSLEPDGNATAQEELKNIRGLLFDIISAQSYQDAARQRLKKLENKLEQIRDVLVKVLVIMNLKKKESSSGQQAQAKKLLEEVNRPSIKGFLEQDLVDELLSEFGL